MFLNNFLNILSFYLQRGISIVIPNHSIEEDLSEIELLQIKYLLSEYDILPEYKSQIYGSSSLCHFIINEKMKMKNMIDYIGNSILSIQLKSTQSLNDYLNSLDDNNIVKIRIMNLLNDDCPVCFEPKPTHCLPCKHMLCNLCSGKVDTCPLCRSSFSIIDVMVKTEESVIDNRFINSDNDSLIETDDININVVKIKKLIVIQEVNFLTFCMKRFQTILLKSNGVLTSIEIDELFLLIKYFEKEIIEKYSSTQVCSEEVRCFVSAILYKIHMNTSLCVYINTPNRILRFLAVLHVEDNKEYGKPNPHHKILLRGGGRHFKSIILKMINQCEECDKSEDEFLRNEMKWKAIFKFVHFGEKKNMEEYPIAFRHANRITNAKKIASLVNKESIIDVQKKIGKKFIFHDIENTESMSTISGKVNKYIDSSNEEIFNYLENKPGLTFRLMRRISLQFENSDNLIPFLKVIIPKMTFEQQVDIYHIFSSSLQKDHPDVAITSKSTIFWKKNEIDKN